MTGIINPACICTIRHANKQIESFYAYNTFIVVTEYEIFREVGMNVQSPWSDPIPEKKIFIGWFLHRIYCRQLNLLLCH